MNEYTFYQDHKGTIWQRSHFSVNAESLNEAKQIIAANNLSSNFVGDLDDGQTIVFHKSEYLYDTLSSMVPDHNQGHATIIVLDSNHETICMNGHDPQVDRSVRKELRVFAWPYKLLPRNASDEEILKAWENGPIPAPEDEREMSEVEIYTPDEFSERINDNKCAFDNYYVRFIIITLCP